MTEFHLVEITSPLYVSGNAEGTSIGEFSGRVIALAVRELDPVAVPEPNGNGRGESEGLLGWGTTFMLVADPDRAAPCWIAKDAISSHSLAPGGSPEDATPARG